MSSGVRSIRVASPAAPGPDAKRVASGRVASMLLITAVIASLTLPGAVFAVVRNWSLSRTPAGVSSGTSVVSVTATNTGDDSGSEAVGCVVIAIPNSAFTVSDVAIVAVGESGDEWSAVYVVGSTDTIVTLWADSGGGDRLYRSEWVRAAITFTDTGLDGTFTWTGNAFNKEDCTDDFGMPRTMTITIDSAVSNDAPAAADDAEATSEDVTLSVGPTGVLANDVDPNGDPLSATLAAAPSHAASFVLRADGSYDYTPEADWSGTDTFTYQVSDGSVLSNVATVTIDVAPVNDPPNGNADSYNGTEDLVLAVNASNGVLANDADVEGDALSAAVDTTTSKGLLTLNANGSFSYVPQLNFSGTDSFTYLVSDGTDASGPITATIDLNGVEDDPVAADDAFSMAEDGLLAPIAPGVLANDTDPDADGLTASLVNGPASATAFTLNANGSFSYRPSADFHGSDSFAYRAFDGSRYSAPVTVSIDVTSVPDDPQPSDDAFVVAEDSTLAISAPGVLANDADADGDALIAAVVSAPTHGSLTLDADGSFSYTPAANFHGSDAFTYEASDGAGAAGRATVTLTVAPVNDGPRPDEDSATVTDGESVLIPVLANDTDVEGESLSLVSVGAPSHGDAGLEGSRVRYTPTPGFVGVDTFRYRVSDGTASTLGTVTVVVMAAPATPPPPEPDPTTSPLPVPTPTPGAATPAEPTPTPTPAEPTPDPTSSPVVLPPPPSQSAAPPVTLPTTGPLSLAPTGTGGGGVDVGLASLGSILGFGWVIPGLTFFGVPGLLLVVGVLVQVSGALAWLPAIRRNLGTFGFRRRRRLRVAERARSWRSVPRGAAGNAPRTSRRRSRR